MRWRRSLLRALGRSNWRAKRVNGCEVGPQDDPTRGRPPKCSGSRGGQDPMGWSEGIWVPENGGEWCRYGSGYYLRSSPGQGLRPGSAGEAGLMFRIRSLRGAANPAGTAGSRPRSSPGKSSGPASFAGLSPKPPFRPPSSGDELGPDRGSLMRSARHRRVIPISYRPP